MLDDVRASLAASGFDIAHAFDADTREPGLAILGRGVGLLVGNTRALWPVFLAALDRDPALAADPDPLDRYTEAAIARAAPRARAYFAHRHYDDRYLPFQRLAVVAGLAALAPIHLVIHPTYGPWFGLRAVIVVDGTPPHPSPIALPCCCGESCMTRLAETSDDWRTWLAVRDSCSIGQAYRYSEDQLTYHYTKDRSILRRER